MSNPSLALENLVYAAHVDLQEDVIVEIADSLMDIPWHCDACIIIWTKLLQYKQYELASEWLNKKLRGRYVLLQVLSAYIQCHGSNEIIMGEIIRYMHWFIYTAMELYIIESMLLDTPYLRRSWEYRCSIIYM